MSIDRASLAKLPEREVVHYIKRLFERMGKQSVRLSADRNRGGPELTYEDYDDSGERSEVFVFVRGGDLAHRSPAKKLVEQVRRSLMPGEGKLPPDGIIVVATGKIAPKVLELVRDSISPGESFGNIQFWDGDLLWDLLQRYVGPSTILASIKDVLSQAGDFEDKFELILDPSNRPTYGYVETEGLRLYVAPKPGHTGSLPFKFRMPAADAQLIQNALVTGGTLHFKEGQASIEAPEPLASFAGPGDLREIRIFPHRMQAPTAEAPRFVDLRVVFQSADRVLNFVDRFSFFVKDSRLHVSNESGTAPQKFSFYLPWPITQTYLTDVNGRVAPGV